MDACAVHAPSLIAPARIAATSSASKHQLVNRNTPSPLQTTATSSPRSRQQAGLMTGHNVTRPGQQHGVDARAPCSSPAAVVADLVSVMDENVMNNKRTTVTGEDVALRHHDDNDDERHHRHHHAHENGSSRDGLVTAGGGSVDEPATADSERHSENEAKSCLSSTQTTLADESRPQEQEQEQATISSPQQEETSLPPGWEKHEDADGAYYWHIRSGTIQRHVPASNLPQCGENGVRLRQHRDSESSSGVSSGSSASSGLTRSCTSSAVNDLAIRRCSHQRNGDKRKSFPSAAFGGATTEATVSGGGRVRFAVRCLGSQEIDERQLTAELSSRTVNKCIVDLALGRGHVANDGIGHWGEGKDLFMDFEDGCVKLREPDSLTVVHSQPIHTIRVWGVGRDNARDFAYVARDRTTRRHVCHVFRCESPARLLSNTLRDMCKKIMIERSLSQSVATRLSETGCGDGVRRNRPTSLILDQRKLVRAPPQTSLTFAGSQNHAFPTPIDEPCRVIRARYMGAVTVKRPSGIDTLNGALDTMVARVTNTGDTSRPSHELWPCVDVCVAPSTITVRRTAETDAQDGGDNDSRGECVLECRVRFLSFLGIGRAVEHCGIVVHTAQDVFVAHGFHCEESAGPLCKTIEAACNLRYQKCLDALPGVMADGGGSSAAQSQIMQQPGGGGAGTAHRSGGRLSHTLRFMLDSLKLPSMVGGDKQRHTASSK